MSEVIVYGRYDCCNALYLSNFEVYLTTLTGEEVLCGSGNPDKGPYYQVEFMHGHGQVRATAVDLAA